MSCGMKVYMDHPPVTIYIAGVLEENSQAGIGVFWGRDHNLNLSTRLTGTQDKNRAAINAAVKALRGARVNRKMRVCLHTENSFLFNAVTKNLTKWQENNWLDKNGNPVDFRDDFEELIFAQAFITVHWFFVDTYSKNEARDAAICLAKTGASSVGE